MSFWDYCCTEFKRDGKSWISQKEVKEKERQENLKATIEEEKKRKQQEAKRFKVETILS